MDFERARRFIFRNARPLDFARWRFAFEGGSREDVRNQAIDAALDLAMELL